MAPRRSLVRPVHLTLPTKDGGKVAVRSRTVAERLVGQAEAIKYLHESAGTLALDLAWQQERMAKLAGASPVAMLLWLRLLRLLPETRPEGWMPNKESVQLGTQGSPAPEQEAP